MIKSFHEFIEENKNEIIALRIIYDHAYKDRPIKVGEAIIYFGGRQQGNARRYYIIKDKGRHF